MALDVGRALREGVSRIGRRNALVFVLVFSVLGLATAAVTQTITAGTLDVLATAIERQGAGPGGPNQGGPGAGPSLDPATVRGAAGPTPLALPVPPVVALAFAVAIALVSEAVSIVAVRAFVGDHGASIPRALVRRNLLVATANGFIGGVIAFVLIAIGLLLFVVPGIFLTVAFLFVRQEVAVDDENFLDALADSWTLTRGNRARLFGLAVVLFALAVLAGMLAGVAGAFGPFVAEVTNALVGAVATTLSIAIVSRAYVQLRADRDGQFGEAFETPPNDAA